VGSLLTRLRPCGRPRRSNTTRDHCYLLRGTGPATSQGSSASGSLRPVAALRTWVRHVNTVLEEHPLVYGLVFGGGSVISYLIDAAVGHHHGQSDSSVLLTAVIVGAVGGFVVGVISYFRRRYNDEPRGFVGELPYRWRTGLGPNGAPSGSCSP